jgi:transposase
VKRRTDAVLTAMDKEFRLAYSKLGRPSIPPEMLLKALLLQSLYTVRSERRLVEEIRVPEGGGATEPAVPLGARIDGEP